MAERYVKRQGRTREEIHKMTDEDLVASLSDEEKQNALAVTRLTFDESPPKKRADESGGSYTKRLRESKEIDKAERARALRENLEQALYAAEASARLMDNLSADLTPETIKEQEARETARQEREDRREMDSDIHVRPKGYGGASGEWEQGKNE